MSTFDGAPANELAAARGEVAHLIASIIGNQDIFEFTPFLQFDAVKQLSGEPIYELLGLIASGDLPAFNTWLAANGGKLKALGMGDKLERVEGIQLFIYLIFTLFHYDHYYYFI